MFSHLEPHFQAFRATIFSLDVQSHPILVQESKATSFSIQAFRATILGIHSHHFSLGVQSHSFQFKRLEPLFSVQALRAAILGVQSHNFFLVQTFRTTIFQFKRSKPSFLAQAFRAIFFYLVVQSHSFWRSKPLFIFYYFLFIYLFIFSLGIQSHSPFVQAFRATFFNFRCLESQF